MISPWKSIDRKKEEDFRTPTLRGRSKEEKRQRRIKRRSQ